MSIIEDLANNVKTAQTKYLAADQTVESAMKTLSSAKEAADKAYAEFNEALKALADQAQA